MKESTVFTVFVCLPTVFITVFNGFHSFHTFCSILESLFFFVGSFGRPWGWFLCRITPPRWAEAYDKKVTAMNDSFTVRVWGNPLPHHRRVPDFPHSAPCFASFMLDNDAAWQTEFA